MEERTRSMQTTPQMLDDVVERLPDNIAVRNAESPTAEPSQITYKELASDSMRLAAALAELGVRKGDRVVILSKPRVRFAVSVIGILRSGAWVVPVDPSFTVQERAAIFNHAQPKAVIAPGELLK